MEFVDPLQPSENRTSFAPDPTENTELRFSKANVRPAGFSRRAIAYIIAEGTNEGVDWRKGFTFSRDHFNSKNHFRWGLTLLSMKKCKISAVCKSDPHHRNNYDGKKLQLRPRNNLVDGKSLRSIIHLILRPS